MSFFENNKKRPQAFKIAPEIFVFFLFSLFFIFLISAFSVLAQQCKPVDIVLVVDRSGSMAETISGETKTKMEMVKEALNGPQCEEISECINNDNCCPISCNATNDNDCTGFIDNLHDQDKIGLVSFSSGVTLDSPLTFDKVAVKTAVNTLAPGGTTNMAGGIRKAREELLGENGRADSPKAMIIVSDGYPDNPALAIQEADAAKSAGIRIITIGYDIEPGSPEEQLMKQIASAPADYHLAPSSDELEAIYADIAGSLCDTTPPTLTLSRSPSGTVFSQDLITFTSVATDDYGLKYHTISWSSDNWITSNVHDCSPVGKNNTCSLQIGPFSSGTEIHYKSFAQDTADNQTCEPSDCSLDYSFKVASVTLSAKRDGISGQFGVDQTNTITAVINDPQGKANLDSYFISIESPAGGELKLDKVQMSCSGDGTTYTCTYTLCPTCDYNVDSTWGSDAKIIFYPYDSVIGFHNSPAQLIVEVVSDTTPPAVAISHSPSDVVLDTDEITLHTTAGDESGLQSQKIIYFVDGVQYSFVCNDSNQDGICDGDPLGRTIGDFSILIGPYPAGTFVQYKAEATDIWGNTASTATYSFTVLSSSCFNPDRTPKPDLSPCPGGGKCCGGLCDTSFSCPSNYDSECYIEICSGTSWTCAPANEGGDCCSGTNCDGCYGYWQTSPCLGKKGYFGCGIRDYYCSSGECVYKWTSISKDQCSGDFCKDYACIGTGCNLIQTIDCSKPNNWDGDSIKCNCNCNGYDRDERVSNGNCNDGKDNDCDGLIDCEEPACDDVAPVTTITAYDSDGNQIPNGGEVIDTKTNPITLNVTSFELAPCDPSPNTLYSVKVLYSINGTNWIEIFTCVDTNTDGKCDADPSKNIANFSVQIPEAGFPAGTRVWYRSIATDTAPVPNTGYDTGFFDVISAECDDQPDLTPCTGGKCCGEVCNTYFDCDLDNECRQEVCFGTRWSCIATNEGNECDSGTWTKRKLIEIDNTSNSYSLEEYQVKLEIPYDDDMKIGFEDLRFTDANGTPLSYWVERVGGILRVRYKGKSGHPANHLQLINNYKFNQLLGKRIVEEIYSPRRLPSAENGDYFNWFYFAHFYVKRPGYWQFAIDGDDAVEVEIDGNIVASWYGGHGFCNCYNHRGQIYLTSGWHRIIVRHEEDWGNDGVVLYFKAPGEINWQIFSIKNLKGKGYVFAHFPEDSVLKSLSFIQNGLTTRIQKAIVWVKIPEIPASSTQTIYMYYGNPEASSLSNGEMTFDFFDDFNTFNTSIWGKTSSTGIWGGLLRIYKGSVYSKNPVSDVAFNRVFESKVRWTHYSYYYAGMSVSEKKYMCGSNSCGLSNVLYMIDYGTHKRKVKYWAGSGLASSYDLGSGNVFTLLDLGGYVTGDFGENFHILSTRILPNSIKLYRDYTLLKTISGSFEKDKPLHLLLGFFTGSSAGSANIKDIAFDWVRVRKTTDPEPTVSFGIEESVSYKESAGCFDYSSGCEEVEETKCHSGYCIPEIPIQTIDYCEGLTLMDYECSEEGCELVSSEIDSYCDREAPEGSIVAYDNEGNPIPNGGQVIDYKTNRVTLSVTSFDNYGVYQVKVYYNVNGGDWSLIKNCIDADGDGFCDGTGDLISAFSVEIPVDGFAEGTTVGYKAEITDKSTAPDGPYTTEISGNFFVIGPFSTPPVVEVTSDNVNDSYVCPNPDCCETHPPEVVVYWTFTDADMPLGDCQKYAQLQFSQDPTFNAIDFDTGKFEFFCDSSRTVFSYTFTTNVEYNKTYYWRVRAWDRGDNVTDWITQDENGNPLSFTTPKHRYPVVDFTYNPTNPEIGEEISFTDQSQCFRTATSPGVKCGTGGTTATYLWDFNYLGGTPTTDSTEENPKHTYYTFMPYYDVYHEVTDQDGYSCYVIKSIPFTAGKYPWWKEIIPKQ